MGETPDNVGPVEVKEADAGPGHNQPKEVVWERWQKKRTFVRALEGTYGELQQGLMDQPRVYKSRDWQWKGGPQFFDKPIINPQRTDIAQSIETHISCIAPGGTGQRHGHMNSALFYIISGKGYDIQTADSPWVLTGEQASLAAMLLEGWAEAATEQQPEQANAIQTWLETRRQQLDADALAITVSHTDLLAWPKQV